MQAEGQRIVERRIREYDKIHCRRSSAAIVRHHCLSAHTAMIRSTIPRITARDDAIISAKCLTGGGGGRKSGFHIAVEIFSKIHLEDNYWRRKKQQESHNTFIVTRSLSTNQHEIDFLQIAGVKKDGRVSRCVFALTKLQI